MLFRSDAGSTLDSYKDFEELVKRFPNSRYAEDSRKRMVALRNSLAMHEIHVADYYMRREAYLAAARRCSIWALSGACKLRAG